MREKFARAFASANLSGRARRFALTCFILRVLGHKLTRTEIEEAYFSPDELRGDYLDQERMEEFIKFDENDYPSSAPAVAKFFASSLFGVGDLTGAG